MLDSISGFRLAFQKQLYSKDDMVKHLHSLSEYLKSLGVTLLKIAEISTITGEFQASDYGISYMADNIIFLRYYEINGQLKKAIGVLKKRLSDYENLLRELAITKYGIKVGQPLRNLRGILSGNPEFVRVFNENEKL